MADISSSQQTGTNLHTQPTTTLSHDQPTDQDQEKQADQHATSNENDFDDAEKKVSAFKALGWLDRFLAVWIFLAMVIGILLGNFVPNTTEAIDKGKFVGVSVPIGKHFPSL